MMLTLERQMLHLQQVSRSFALTIPLLPATLADWVGHAYLLCRIVDTIEDDAQMDCASKQTHLQRWVEVLTDPATAAGWTDQLLALLGPQTPAAERALVADIPAVLARFASYPPAVQQVLRRGVTIMSQGMAAQLLASAPQTQYDLDRYCYAVAGVVGELLTELFCLYCPALVARRDQLFPLAVAFGEGLQLTNILKDIGEDAARGVCWLPAEALQAAGLEAASLAHATASCRAELLTPLLGITHGYLRAALSFTLLLPAREQGMRQFCLLAIALALPTLDNIRRQPGFRSGQAVKVSRRQVKAIVIACRLAGRSDTLLRAGFAWLGRHLPTAEVDCGHLWQRVSRWESLPS